MTGPPVRSRLPPWQPVLAAAAVMLALLASVVLFQPFTGRAIATEVVRAPARAAVGSPATARTGAVPRVERVVVLGDSVAAASGCSCAGFATLLAADLAARSAGPTPVTNAAQDGLTTAGLLDQLHDPALAGRLRVATVVTVTIGANDFDAARADDTACDTGPAVSCYRQQLATTTGQLRELFTVLRRGAPGASILVTGYWNVFLDGDVARAHGPGYRRTSDELTRALNRALEDQAAQAGLRYVDLYTPFQSAGAAGLTALLAPDGDHPSSAGHRLIAATLLSASPPPGSADRGAP